MRVIDLARADERAVSPVIGVVLMVAITVILAAVIGTFVLGIGSSDAVPQTDFGFEPTILSGQPDELTVSHEGGDPIANDQLLFTANVPLQDEDGSDTGDRLSWYTAAKDSGGGPAGASVSAGASVRIEPHDPDPDLAGKTITVVWRSDSGEKTHTLTEWSLGA